MTKILNTDHIMADKQNSPTHIPTYTLHLPNCFFLKFSIAHSKYFINY